MNDCFAPSPVDVQPADSPVNEQRFKIVTVSPFRSRAAIETGPDDAGRQRATGHYHHNLFCLAQ